MVATAVLAVARCRMVAQWHAAAVARHGNLSLPAAGSAPRGKLELLAGRGRPSAQQENDEQQSRQHARAAQPFKSQ
jgi:hypothetical protein